MSTSTGYLGNPKLRRAFTAVSMTQHEVDEYKKCVKDPIYFVRNYVKIVALGRGIIPFDLYDFQEEMIKTFIEERFVICKIPRQSGKALPLTEDILTTKGFIKFGDLKVGDTIYGKNGKETKVLSVTETMYNHNCYKIYLDDGSDIIADEEHLWEIGCTHWNKNRVIDTKTLLEIHEKKKKSGVGTYIEINEPLQFPEKNLPIDPYTLGVWLGDGTKRSAQITCHVDDEKCYLENIPYEFTSIIHNIKKENITTITPKGLFKCLRENNLLNNKHIPKEYIYSSIEQRLELIRGLMDTDGYCSKKGVLEFYQKDETLIDDLKLMLRTLGIKTRKKFKTIKGIRYFCLSFFSNRFTFFKLQRKLERQGKHIYHTKINERLYIKSIEKVDSVPVRCITVDNDDKLFLIGKNLIPTHNSITTLAFLLHSILFNQNYNIAILAHKGSAANGLLARLKLAYENLPKWLQSGIIEWNKGNIELENGSKIGAFATSADGLRSGSYDTILLDEFAFVPQSIAEAFFTSTYPVITAGNKTKIIIVSTPNGMNHFFTMWVKAEKGLSDYKPIEVHWSAVPGRDEKWREETIRNTSPEQFQQEFECLHGDTKIEILDTKTNEIIELTIEKLYNLVQDEFYRNVK